MSRARIARFLRRRRQRGRARRVIALTALVLLAVFAGYVVYLDQLVRAQFEGKRWALPARVYAQPLELYPGLKLTPAQLAAELVALGYRADLDVPGSFRHRGHELEIHSRPFVFWDGPQPAVRFRAAFLGDRVSALLDLERETALDLVRLDPLPIGGIYPAHNEDRLLVQLRDATPMLARALIAVEDHSFHSHSGIDPRGIARAIVTNIRGGQVQGGSTITQQLVKNFYLTAERSLRRKFTEMIMALLLEAHYDKDEILEAYFNEIYLGQDGDRAIHGFGLASQFYFNRALADLDLPQVALLVGLVKGPSYYDPRRHPERALARRNLVLTELARQEVITGAELVQAKATPLGVVTHPARGTSPFPAFIDLVHRQLRRDYDEDDLRSEGLKIFTTLDPRTQRVAEQALAQRLAALETERRLPAGALQAATIVTNADNGEVLAVVGGRDVHYAGFNRALDAERQVGSLMKPVVYLTALQRPHHFTLATVLDDSPFSWRDRGGEDWTPQNYDKQFHGAVPLRIALAESYNVAAARLGLALGVPAVVDNLRRLGIERDIAPYGSLLLGAVNLTPIEVTQMYQTLASGGFRTPLRAIREVLTAQDQPLTRYPLEVAPVFEPAPVYLLTTALQEVVRSGTATGLQAYLPARVKPAGKTGTTDDLRDGWFAGFTGDRLAVVWVGRDDNRPSGLTGASGAMTIWGRIMAGLDPAPLEPAMPETIERAWIDPATGLRADADCKDAVELPFIRGSAPQDRAPCARHSPVKAIQNWFRRWFDR